MAMAWAGPHGMNCSCPAGHLFLPSPKASWAAGNIARSCFGDAVAIMAVRLEQPAGEHNNLGTMRRQSPHHPPSCEHPLGVGNGMYVYTICEPIPSWAQSSGKWVCSLNSQPFIVEKP